jgi:hypothetical protein
MQEVAPGEYTSTVKIPAAGRYDVAFILETPEILHCFSAEVGEGTAPLIHPDAMAVEYLQKSQRVAAHHTLPLRFRLINEHTKEPVSGIDGVSVMFFRTPGADRTVVPAVAESDGVYVASLPIDRAGAYYVQVGIPSRSVGYEKLQYFTLIAVDEEPAQ